MNILCCLKCTKRPKAQSVHPPPINNPSHIVYSYITFHIGSIIHRKAKDVHIRSA